MTQPRTHIRVTWVAQVYDKPVVTAHTWDDLVAGVDEYYGIGKDPKAKKIRYTPNDSPYVESFDGYFEYEVDDLYGGIELERVNVYCVDFYPETRYEVIVDNNYGDDGEDD